VRRPTARITPLDVFPWQTHVTAKMLNQYLSLGPWLDRLMSLSEHYDVSIGHLEDDQPLFVSDISLARRLVQQDMVLWWSSSEQPDLGGAENDKRPVKELPKTEYMSPGSYSNVCLEVTVRNLAVNSVIHSVVVNELEGAGGATSFDSVSKTLDEYGSREGQRDLTLGESNVSTQTFGVIKNMVKTWLIDRFQNNVDSPASLAIDHFWWWLSSPTSQMYDPGIHRFVHGLMRKTFIQLLAEYKRLGLQVIYADFSRILLATAKPPGTAHAYATYINIAVTSHELFQHIYLHTERFMTMFYSCTKQTWEA
jgi:DNA polymerase epsilon subunit 1